MRKNFSSKNWDWSLFLNSDPRTKKKHKELAKQLAGSWTTCACAQYAFGVEKRLGDVPLDDGLYRIGHLFSSSIEKENWIQAASAIKAIQFRAFQLGIDND